MPKFRVHKTNDYTVMSNSHLREREMSLKAKGIMTIMLSLPEDWDYSIESLVELSSDGRDGVSSALRELERFGYLRRTFVTDDMGRFSDIVYDLYESPGVGNSENPSTEEPSTEEPSTEKPFTENPFTVETRINRPFAENPFTVSEKEEEEAEERAREKNEKERSKEKEKRVLEKEGEEGEETSVRFHADVVPAWEMRFNEFWDAYPRKVDKKKARIAFHNINPGADKFSKIMGALEAQKNSKQWRENNGSYIPHPTTWLHGERWNDEVRGDVNVVEQWMSARKEAELRGVLR